MFTRTRFDNFDTLTLKHECQILIFSFHGKKILDLDLRYPRCLSLLAEGYFWTCRDERGCRVG